MAGCGLHWSEPPGWQIGRRELVLAIHLTAACVVALAFIDQWLAAVLGEIQHSSIVFALRQMPDRARLSVVILVLMGLLIVYRTFTGDRGSTDKGMFVLGCGVVAGCLSDQLKLAFGRPTPAFPLPDGSHAFHFFGGGSGFDSFPSSHAAMAAGIAGSVCILWSAQRHIVILIAGAIVTSRFISGAHFLSDALLGAAVGLFTVVCMQLFFHHCGINLGSPRRAK